MNTWIQRGVPFKSHPRRSGYRSCKTQRNSEREKNKLHSTRGRARSRPKREMTYETSKSEYQIASPRRGVFVSGDDGGEFARSNPALRRNQRREIHSAAASGRWLGREGQPHQYRFSRRLF